MSATSQYTTFSDLYTALQVAVRVTTSVTATETIAKRMINVALHDMHLGTDYRFPWAERSALIRTRDQYTTGTLTATKGSTTLTGSSTTWNTVDSFSVANMRANGKIRITGLTHYTIESVGSDTSAVLATKFVDTTTSGATYVYYEDEYDLASDFLRPVDLQRFSDPMSIDLIGRTDFRRRFPTNSTPSARPAVATIIDYAPSGNTTPIRRVRFSPPPSTALLIPYTYITGNLAVSSAGVATANMSASTDEPIVPLRYRGAIFFHALYNWYRDRKDDTRANDAKAEYTDIMLRITSDVEVGANRPQIRPRVSGYARRAQRPWSGRSARRFDVNGRFDRMDD